jgi:hypothetical protein
LSEAVRREGEILARLKSDLKNKRVVIVVGVGVTLSATADALGKPLSRITWTGLIRNGLDYLVNDDYVEASNRRTRRAYEALEDPDTDSLLDAANTLSSQLTQHGQVPTWLETVFGSLDQEIRHPAILEALKALHEKGATLLTTNYDDLLEKYCHLRRIGRSNQDEILKFKRGDLDGVFHVHGSYHDPQEVVLDTTAYYEVTHSDEVQNVLKTFLEYKTRLFIGCGSGLEDPNFDALLKWASERQKNIPNRHCLLIRDGDNLKYKPLVRLMYGHDYQDLAPYLNKLLDEPPRPAITTADIPLPVRNNDFASPSSSPVSSGLIMEPLSALIVATSVAQFVGFASRVISGSVELFRSASSTSAECSEIEALTTQSMDMLRTLYASSRSTSPQLRSKYESKLKKLCGQCEDPAKRLLDILKSLKIKGKHRTTESSFLTLKPMEKEKEIQRLREQLHSVQTELVLCLQLILKYITSNLFHFLANLFPLQ